MTASPVELHVAAPLGLGTTEVLIILGILVLLFGAKRLPELAKGFGKSIKEFKKATSEESTEEEDAEDKKPSPMPKNGTPKAASKTELPK